MRIIAIAAACLVPLLVAEACAAQDWKAFEDPSAVVSASSNTFLLPPTAVAHSRLGLFPASC